MRLGVVFAQSEIGSDPAVIHDYAQAERAGHARLLVFDHVLGAKLERFDMLGRQPPYLTKALSMRCSFSSVTWVPAPGASSSSQASSYYRSARPRGGEAGRGPARRPVAPRRRHRLEPCRVHPSTCATSYPGVDGRNGE
jgi:hypothetical protein